MLFLPKFKGADLKIADCVSPNVLTQLVAHWFHQDYNKTKYFLPEFRGADLKITDCVSPNVLTQLVAHLFHQDCKKDVIFT